jgi:hypothetical protein
MNSICMKNLFLVSIFIVVVSFFSSAQEKPFSGQSTFAARLLELKNHWLDKDTSCPDGYYYLVLLYNAVSNKIELYTHSKKLNTEFIDSVKLIINKAQKIWNYTYFKKSKKTIIQPVFIKGHGCLPSQEEQRKREMDDAAVYHYMDVSRLISIYRSLRDLQNEFYKKGYMEDCLYLEPVIIKQNLSNHLPVK